jgi:hypothetical protein
LGNSVVDLNEVKTQPNKQCTRDIWNIGLKETMNAHLLKYWKELDLVDIASMLEA